MSNDTQSTGDTPEVRVTQETIDQARHRYREKMRAAADRARRKAESEKDAERRRKAWGSYYRLVEMENYEPVEVRLLEFRRDHPTGEIETEVLAKCVRAVLRVDGVLLATGHKPIDPNRRGMELEAAETGAVGRALMFAGYDVLHVDDVPEDGNGYLDFHDALERAQSLDELRDIGRVLSERGDRLTVEEIAKLRTLYAARQNEFTNGEATT